MSNRLQLPACQKCKLRKVRCDRQAPQCGNCTRANAACIILDPETGGQYTRGHIWQLENEERSLNQKLQQQYNPRGESGENPASPARNHAQPGTVEGRHSEQPDSQANTPSRSYFVGHGSGLEFLQNILSDAKWQQHRAHILNQLAARPRLERQRLTPIPLPPLEEAERLLDNYFTHFHIHHAFVLRSDVFSIFYRLYSLTTADNTVSNQDRFRLFMVFAISATTKHRSGLGLQDPYRYFKAAELYLGKITLIKDIDAIQNLLLVARFGMYHHVNTSLWDISQVCMRQCIEWQLHLRSSEVLDPLAEQHRRRIFWVTYILDRYNSGILGRPFGIQDRDITVPLPLDVDDSTIVNSNADSLDTILPNTSSQPTELSVFIHCIKLRQISSRIHTDLYTGRPPASQPGNYDIGSPSSRFKSIGHLYTAFSQFRSELKSWHSTCPVFPSPKSLYEKAEWHDFLHEKDIMLLARGALHNIPPRLYSSGSVIEEIFVSCYESASRVIELYGNLMRKGAITWTRSYFQVIFTAGLTVIYCISQEVVKDWMGSRQPRGTLALCRDILALFREKMPDAGSFTFVFEVLEAECIRSKINQEGETQCAETPVPYNITNQQPGANTTAASCIGAASHAILPASEQAHMNEFSMQPFGVEQADTGLDVMGNLDLMIHLGTELDEYAWGWIPMDGNLWDGTSLYQV